MDKVSIILPVYNSEKYVKHTISSIFNQVYKSWELIIVNDASTDNSLNEIYNASKNDERIKVISLKENKGVSYCRNIAIKQATGRYLAFIDADDLWAKEKLSNQIVFMRKHNAHISHTGCAFMNSRGEIRPTGQVSVDEKIDLKKYLKTSQIRMSTVMIDYKYIKDIHFPEDRKLCEDARVWTSLLRSGENFYGLNQILMLYRVHPEQASKNKGKMALNAFKRFMNEKSLTKSERISCFIQYARNAIKLWKRKNNLDIDAIKSSFNCR